MKSSATTPDIRRDPRWAAVLARDPASDGRFVYAVRSTGIYCRPTCPSRRAHPENVAFYPDPAAAEQAGFRPCRRCRPDGPSPALRQAATIADLCRHIESAEQPPTLDQLAARAGLSAYHLHRQFKAATGLTPGAYARARRADRLRQALPASPTVTEAIYAAGYNADSRFYAEAGQLLGMPPATYRRGGAGQRIAYALDTCSLGKVLVARTTHGLCAILLGDEAPPLVDDLRRRFPQAEVEADHGLLAESLARVVACIDAPGTALDLPLDIRGTAFQQRVWLALRAIPAGQTTTYSELAERIDAPRAVRAVAAACAANPLAVVVPCHRVLRRDGDLAGYRWGLERKRALLEREAES
jgi:AraC family transcriptional regulator of adaptative response/methylated-DNA-[protein]-cysteine methyltransferase